MFKGEEPLDNRTKAQKFKIFDKRLGYWQISFAVFAVIMLVYLFFLQIIDIKHYKKLAERQTVRTNFVMRGDIFDRNGIKLASDKAIFDVYAHPSDYKHTPEELAKILAPYLKISPNVLASRFSTISIYSLTKS